MLDVDNALIVLRSVVLIAQSGIFGTLCVRALAGRDVGDRLLGGLFFSLLIVLPVWLVVQSVQMGGSVSSVWLVVSMTQIGHLAAARGIAWIASFLLWRTRGTVWALIPAGLALALHAGAGHAAALGEVWLLLTVMAHVCAGAAWIGGLPALWIALDHPSAPQLVARYAWFGLVCVLIVTASATAQAYVLAGGLPGLFGTSYGDALVAKIALLLIILILASLHRFVLAPLLPVSLGMLRVSVSIEACFGLGILIAASILVSQPPGAHTQPDWPFAWRFSLDLMDDDEFRAEVLNALRALGGAVLLLLLAILSRRVRWLAVAAAAVITWFALPHFDLLFLPTEPTYYWQSTTGGTLESITAGRVAFEANCTRCHGPAGHGDGPEARTLPIPPADLTAQHLWDHPEGELYWWIAHGMPGPRGQAAMPGFSPALSEKTIWSLIDFLHANNPNRPTDGQPMLRHIHQ